jgi:hypothetical protein
MKTGRGMGKGNEGRGDERTANCRNQETRKKKEDK